MYGLIVNTTMLASYLPMQATAEQTDQNFGWHALLLVGAFIVCSVLMGTLEKGGCLGKVLAAIAMTGALVTALAALLYTFAWIVNMK